MEDLSSSYHHFNFLLQSHDIFIAEVFYPPLVRCILRCLIFLSDYEWDICPDFFLSKYIFGIYKSYWFFKNQSLCLAILWCLLDLRVFRRCYRVLQV